MDCKAHVGFSLGPVKKRRKLVLRPVFFNYPWSLGACVASILASLTNDVTITEQPDWDDLSRRLKSFRLPT